MKDTITTNTIVQSINADNPIYQIEEKEFNDSLLKFGSLVSIIKNKRINQTMLMVELLGSEDYRNCFKKICGIDRNEVLFFNFILMFPVLCKSKIIKNKIEELYNGKSEGKGIL